MMQAMWPPMKRHTFNALLALLTLILRDRFSTVFASTVPPAIDTAALFTPFDGLNSGEVHASGNVARTIDVAASDFYQFNDIDPSQLFADTDTTFKPSNFSDPDAFDYQFNGKAIIADASDETSTETFGTFFKIYSVYPVYPTLFDIPSLMNSRVTFKRILPKPVHAHIIRTTVKRPISPLYGIADSLRIKLKAIYPGTLWCGDGNYARSANEIGLFRNTDSCCKQHDQCPGFIRSGSEFKGLRNSGLFTRSHCDCDQKFYTCLKSIDTLISNKIGYTYFNILKPKCFRKEYPIVGCRKWINNKCYSYTVDNERPPVWQWFENNVY